MQVNGVDLAFQTRGGEEGLPLFWGHGLMGSMAQEDEAGMLPWAHLPESIRLIRWDARGHGLSEASRPPEDYRWNRLAEDLWALADAMGVDRGVLGGVSMGAATALHAGVLAPNRTRGLVLMAPPTAWESRPRQARLYSTGARLVDFVGLRPLGLLGELGALAVSNRGLAAIQRSVARGMRRADSRAVRASLRGAALSDLPSRTLLGKLEMPVLILAWSQDPSHPISTAETLADYLPQPELHIARSFEAVERWGEILSRFLANLPDV